jgi:hypothetical protein
VIRFGSEEPDASLLLPGTLVEVAELRGGIPPKVSK